jgi:hypothetical protein
MILTLIILTPIISFAAEWKSDAGHELDALGLHPDFGILGIVKDIRESKSVAAFHENGVLASRKTHTSAEVEAKIVFEPVFDVLLFNDHFFSLKFSLKGGLGAPQETDSRARYQVRPRLPRAKRQLEQHRQLELVHLFLPQQRLHTLHQQRAIIRLRKRILDAQSKSFGNQIKVATLTKNTI